MAAPKTEGGTGSAASGGAGALPPPPKSVSPDHTPVPTKERSRGGAGGGTDPRFRGGDKASLTFSHLSDLPDELKLDNSRSKTILMVVSLVLLVVGIVLMVIFLSKVDEKQKKEELQRAGAEPSLASADGGGAQRRETPPPPKVVEYRPPPEPRLESGKHGSAAVKKALMAEYGEAFKCYEKVFKPEDFLELTITAKRSGEVATVEVNSNSSGNKEAEACVQKALRKANLGALPKKVKAASTIVKWRMINTPENPPAAPTSPAPVPTPPTAPR